MPRAWFLLLFLPFYSIPSTATSQGCPLPLPGEAAGTVIFTEEQENILGDAIAEYIGRHFLVLEDDELNSRLRQNADRLLAHIPPTSIRFQFYLASVPVADAFGLPGGRIFVSRKLVALTRNEDELAGVLAHEIGHLLMRDQAVELSRQFREILNVTEMGDRDDVFEKFHLLIENARTGRQRSSRNNRNEQREQLLADRVGLYLAAAAGYRPDAFGQFWDRMAHTKGKTGGWFSDFFGRTPPESRRLREMVRTTESLPGECRGERIESNEEEFRAWQAQVVSFSGLGRKESLPGVITRQSLDPPLPSETSHLRFSPDGRYLLAQDSSSLHVLTREPLEPLFRIDAPDAFPAEFSSDSETVVFWTPTLRVEQWDVDEEEQVGVWELSPRKACLQTLVSSDARTMACFDNDYGILLIDVETGEEISERKNFVVTITPLEALQALLDSLLEEGAVRLVQMRFSPDGRYFIAARGDTTFAFDLAERTSVSLAGPVKRVLGGGFTFVTADRILGVNHRDTRRSALVGFPNGPEIDRHTLGRQRLDVAANPAYVLLRPLTKYPLGIYDWKAKKMVGASKQSVFDVIGDAFVHEADSGELALHRMGSGEVMAAASLPLSPLGGLRAVAVSPELDWVALSGRSRGGVWNVESGRQSYLVHGFDGAYFAADGTLYADFPKSDEHPRRMIRMHLSRYQTGQAYVMEQEHALQHGSLLISVIPQAKDGRAPEDVILEVGSSTDGAELWKRAFRHEAPRVMVYDMGGTITLIWRASSRAVEGEVAKFSELASRYRRMRKRDGDYYVEVVDAKTGESRGGVIVETGRGSFRIERASAEGDWLLVSDSENRVLLYSISTGDLRGRFFGRFAELAVGANLLVLENELGKLTLYDLRTMRPLNQMTFTSQVFLVQFAPGGKRMLVVTADQTAYTFDIARAVPGAASRSAALPFER